MGGDSFGGNIVIAIDILAKESNLLDSLLL
jgi:hypothetical protein